MARDSSRNFKGIPSWPDIWHFFCERLLQMSKLLSIAVVLLILWVVLKVVLAVTSGVLHVLWIIAVILAVMWLVGKLRGSK